MINEPSAKYWPNPAVSPVDLPADEYRPDYAVSPGEVLEYELELRRMSRSELARRAGLTAEHIDAILGATGESGITTDTAIRLERALGMPADYWLNLESGYQETRARLAASESFPWRAKIA